MKKLTAASLLAVFMATQATAGPNYVVQPIPVGTETVRYIQSVPTLDLRRAHGSVQVTPLPADHGSLAFSVAVYNGGTAPANVDISSFDINVDGQKLGVFSRSDLEHKVKHRAMWNQIALAAAGGLAAAAAASQRDEYHGTLVTPHGTYHSYYSAPSAIGQIQATAIAAGTGVGIAAIQNQLDKTREALGATTVQLTTIDPGDSYAGRVVLNKIKTGKLPQKVAIVVNWNGEGYPFAFQLAKRGTPQPAFPIGVAPVAPVAVTDPVAPSVIATPTPQTVTPK